MFGFSEPARARARAGARAVGTVFLAATLSLGPVPARAWAEAASALTAVEAEAEAGSGSGVGAPANQGAGVAGSGAAASSGTEAGSTGDGATAAGGSSGVASSGSSPSSNAGGSPEADGSASGAAPTAPSAAADDGAGDQGASGGAPDSEAPADEPAEGSAAGQEPASDAANAAPLAEGASDAAGGADEASDEDAQVTAVLSVVGVDGDGNAQTWAPAASYTLDAGSTAADLSEQAFSAAGLTADYGQSSYGWYLNTITSPFDSGRTLGYDAGTGKYWQLFVNGAASDTGADGVALEDGTVITWAYSAYGEEPGQADIAASATVIGADADGAPQVWASDTLALPAGSTAADLSERLFSRAGITADYGMGSWGWELNTITSPFDSGLTLGYDAATGKYWQLFVNGTASDTGAGGVTLNPGDTVTWYFSAYGDSLPADDPDDGGEGDTPGDNPGTVVDGVEVKPDAERPVDWESPWPGYASGAVEGVATPAEGSEEAWVSEIKDSSDWATNVSDPIVVNGRVYVAAGNRLLVKDRATGETTAQAELVAPIDSVARMVYADGLVVVPMAGGRLQALTADTLTTVWVTGELDQIDATGAQQSLTALTVGDGCVYYGTAAAGWSASYSGYVVCVSLADGSVRWSNANDKTGYYWAGVALVDGWAVIADDAGTLQVLDAQTGKQASTLDLGAGARSAVVAGSAAGTVFTVTTDGVLHRLSISPDGSVAETGRVAFGSSSTSTPVVSGGKVYVGGASSTGTPNSWGGISYGGVLAVIDEDTLKIENLVTTADGSALPADSKSAPLVSAQNGATYVYFTCNGMPGGIYRYRVGDAEATLLYTPGEDYQNYAMSSIVCDESGTLYYVNDSGALFAVRGAASAGGSGNAGGDGAGSGDNHHAGGGGNGGAGTGENNGGAGAGAGDGRGDGASTPTGTVAPASRPLGTVAPAMAPLTGGQLLAMIVTGQASLEAADATAAADVADGADDGAAVAAEAAGAAARATSPSASGTAASSDVANRPDPLPAFVALGVGAACLVAAGLWLALTRGKQA